MFVIKGRWRLTLKQEVSGYDITGGDNVVRVRSLMRSVSVRLEGDLLCQIIDKVL